MGVLTASQVEQFRRDGYLKFGRVISDDQAGLLRDDLDKVISGEFAKDMGDDGFPPEFGWGASRSVYEDGKYKGPAIHQYVNMWKVVPSYREMIHHPQIVGAMKQLIGCEKVRLWHDQVISKPPKENGHFGNHHDFYFWPLDRPRMVTCWLALDDATPENGCMHVVPGSHRDPRYQPADCDMGEDIFLKPEPGGPEPPGSLYHEIRSWMPDKATPVILKAGECMFHHCLNYHMTPQNVTDRQRRALILIYMPDGTRYKHAQSPNHPCTHYMNLTDGQLMDGPAFPICGE